MEIQINYLNKDYKSPSESKKGDDVFKVGWLYRQKTYISDWMDEDIKQSTVSHFVSHVVIKDAQLTTKKSIEDMIEFLTLAKESFKV